MSSNHVQILADALTRDFGSMTPHTDPIDSAPVPVRVIDCVLSLNRRYDGFVRPRVVRFMEEHPEVTDCLQLRALVASFATPGDFSRAVLHMNFDARAQVLVGMVDYVIRIQREHSGLTEADRMTEWAQQMRPQDYLTVGVKGFGIAGFQYLRLLLGADTVKPDVHILRYVRNVTASPLSDVEAIACIEQAALIAGVTVRAIDSAIWVAGARP